MRRVVALLALIAGGALMPRLAAACAGCRNPNVPLTRLEAVHLAPGQVRASAVATATSLNVVHEAGCRDVNACAEVPVQPTYLHDQNLWPGELRAVAEVGLTARFGIEAQVPFRVTATSVEYSRPDGAPYEPLDPGVHHRNETLAGIGDPWLLGRYATTTAGVLITARGGVSVPVARTQSNPFVLGARGLRHQHIQFGTGTFDPLVALDASRLFGRWQGSAYAQAQLALYENKHGFRAGTRYFVGAQGGRKLFGGLSGALGLDLLGEGAERWDGRIQQDGNLGRTEILAGLTFVQTFGQTAVGLAARLPVYRHIVTGDEPMGRLSSPLLATLTISRTFGR